MAKQGGFYGVRRGRSVGVFETWEECAASVNGYACAEYKKFKTRALAEQFVGQTTAVSEENDLISASDTGHGSTDDLATKVKLEGSVEFEPGLVIQSNHVHYPNFESRTDSDILTIMKSDNERKSAIYNNNIVNYQTVCHFCCHQLPMRTWDLTLAPNLNAAARLKSNGLGKRCLRNKQAACVCCMQSSFFGAEQERRTPFFYFTDDESYSGSSRRKRFFNLTPSYSASASAIIPFSAWDWDALFVPFKFNTNKRRKHEVSLSTAAELRAMAAADSSATVRVMRNASDIFDSEYDDCAVVEDHAGILGSKDTLCEPTGAVDMVRVFDRLILLRRDASPLLDVPGLRDTLANRYLDRASSECKPDAASDN